MYAEDEKDKEDESSIGAWYSYYKGIESHVQLYDKDLLVYRIDYNEYTGGVCPFGINDGVKVYLDVSLKRFVTFFPACGSHNSAIELTPDELEQYSANCQGWVDLCKGWQE